MIGLDGKTVYLAGPMSGLVEFNAPAFQYAESQIRELSTARAVINPARHPVGLSLVHYYELGVIDARNADMLVLLPGWRRSRGVLMELTARAPRFRWHMSAHAIVRLLLEVKIEEVAMRLEAIRPEERGAVEFEALN